MLKSHNLQARLNRLEKQAGIAACPGLFVAVKSYSEDDDIDALLASHGIDPNDPRHQVVILQNLSQQLPAEILYSMPR